MKADKQGHRNVRRKSDVFARKKYETRERFNAGSNDVIDLL